MLPQQLTAPIPTTRVQEVNQYRNVELLGSILCGLISVFGAQDGETINTKANGIWESPKAYQGIEGMVRERCLVDLIAGCGELALNPEHEGPGQPAWKAKFSGLIEGSVPHATTMMLVHSMLMRLYQHPNQRTVASTLVSSTSYITRLVSTAHIQMSFTGSRVKASWRAEHH